MTIINVIVDLATLIALGVSIWQIIKTRKAAKAAEDAAISTKIILKDNFALVDISICVKLVQEVITFLRIRKYDLAQLRTTDLSSSLEQLAPTVTKKELNIRSMLTELTIIRTILENHLHKPTEDLDTSLIIKKLMNISQGLNVCIGTKKFNIGGERYDTRELL